MINIEDVPHIDVMSLTLLKSYSDEPSRNFNFDKAIGELHEGRENYEKALTYLRNAELHGDHRASYLIGIWYLLGNHPSLERSYTVSAQKLKMSALACVPEGCFVYAKLLMVGCGVKKNTKKALEYFMQGALLGDISSHYEVAIHYDEGIGVPQNRRIANIWRQRADYLLSDWQKTNSEL